MDMVYSRLLLVLVPNSCALPGPNTSKFLDPPVRVLQTNTEVFGPPLKDVDRLWFISSLALSTSSMKVTMTKKQSMNIYSPVKYRWRDVYACACWRMSVSMSSPSPSLSLFGSFIRCFHLAVCASTLVTLIFILTLRVTSSDSRPKRR